MWFNILKNEGRRAAYRFYVNSLVHLGEFIPPKTPATKNEEDPTDPFYIFESSNGHFKWEVRYDWDKLNSFGLIEMPDFVEPHQTYIEGMFENEYPEHHAALRKFFVENNPEPSSNPRPENPKDEVPVPIEDLVRTATEKLERHYLQFINQLKNALIERYDIPLHITVNIQNEIQDYFPNSITVLSALPFRPSAARIMRTYQDILRNNLQSHNQSFVWENFINLIVNFRKEYSNAIIARADTYLSAENIRREELKNIIELNQYSVSLISERCINNNLQDLRTFVDNLESWE